jgi:hypothetical protein
VPQNRDSWISAVLLQARRERWHCERYRSSPRSQVVRWQREKVRAGHVRASGWAVDPKTVPVHEQRVGRPRGKRGQRRHREYDESDCGDANEDRPHLRGDSIAGPAAGSGAPRSQP